ncbi:MAG: YpdA family putative bacillithiol disulfide reductase [Candidatus Cyclobacteriaceae bacterium M2_1C_046]
MSETIEQTDLIIIGAGPIGLACGIAAKKTGFSSIIIDKGPLVNSIYNYPLNMTFFSTSERLEIGEVPFISHNPKPTRSEALEYYRRVAMFWELCTCLYETVESVTKEGNGFLTQTNRKNYRSKAVIIATGFYDIPYPLNVKGEGLQKVKHYYDEPHPYYDMRVAVVGAANSAVDVALETFRKGAKEVTMVMREKEISESVKYWVKPDIENRIKEGTIKSYFDSHITEIREHEIDIITPEGPMTLNNDFVLAMTGYQPDFSFLKACGIKIRNDEFKTPAYDEDTMETNVDRLYLAGVICGGLKTNKWFIENSREHADLIINDLKQKIEK